jgi:uroporphyrinogen-III decarboxylase
MGMGSRERMRVAMRLGTPDRVPVMCQLALGHYFLHAGLDAIDIWHDTDALADALIRMQRRYRFDGILVNLPGRDPRWREHVASIESREDERVIVWSNGWATVVPADDNPHVYRPDGTRYFPGFDEVDPERLFYVEPHEASGITYPVTWGVDAEPARPGPDFFPPWRHDTITALVQRAGLEVSIHGEVFSPFSQLMELLDYTNALMALVDDPGKVRACLERLTEGTVVLASGQAEAGADAILISSAFAGAGLISRAHYETFVLPYERAVIDGIRARYDLPIYTHTCGAIGDRLDLMEATGTNGIDTLDPPPLGTVDLAEARRRTRGRLFIKGNVDPVHTLLKGTRADVLDAARERIETAAPGGGYILSTACSVSPATPPENVLALAEAAEQWGRYDGTGGLEPGARSDER